MHHELWLDEAHHWLLARDSTSLVDLVKNTRYEGHPILWNVLLYGITRFTLNPFAMQVFHILISTSVVFLFLRKAPFSWLFKTLFIFGYFMIFEYNLISRNYMLGVLFLFLACSVFKDLDRKFILLCVYLALAANVHLMFSVLALALFLTVVWERQQQHLLFKKRNDNWGYFIFGFGLLLTIIQIIPPADSTFFNHVNEMVFTEKFTKGFISLFKGLMTIPDFTTIHFWNSNFLVNASKPFSALLGLLVYTLPMLLFYKNKKTLFFAYIALFGTQIFFFITQMSATRHDGMTYIIIIMALWIEHYFAKEDYALKRFLNATPAPFLKNPILYSILSIQFLSGVYAYAMDYQYPFTTSKDTVCYLKERKLNTKTIITVTCDGTLISPYLEKKVWFLCDGSFQSYCHWDFVCAMDISKKRIIAMISDYMETHTETIYVSNYTLFNHVKPNVWIIVNKNIKVRLLKKFDQSIDKNDSYIFEVAKNNSLN